MRQSFLAWIGFLLCALGPGFASGQVPSSEPKPRLSIAEELGLSPPGGLAGGGQHVTFFGSFTIEKGSRKGILSLAATIEPGWHVYSIDQPPNGPMPSKIKVKETSEFKLTGKFQPDRAPHVKPPDVFPVPSEEHEGSIVWSAPIELVGDEKPEALTIELVYSGQVCSRECVPIFGQKVEAQFADYTAPPETPGEYHPGPSQAELVLSGHVEPAAAAPGGKAKLVITATPNPGWHVYAYASKDPDTVGTNKPTLIHLAPISGWTRSPVKASVVPKGNYHEEPVTWTIELAAPADSPIGEVVLTGYIGLQTCNEKSCLPPHAVQFRASIPVASQEKPGKIPLAFISLKREAAENGETSRSIPSAAVVAVTGYADVAKLAAENPAPTGRVDFAALLPIVGFGLLGGLILNLMPCVLPVIGLKILSFVQQGGQSRGKIFALNAWFSLGLLAVFLALATVAAFGSLIPFLGQNLSWGQQFTFTSFKVAMVVVVFAFALSFLGVWEVPIPGFAQSSTSSKLQHQEGPAGAFFKGVFTTLLATPCSGPFLGPVFAFTLAQPPLATYIIFLSVGVGMASPYLVIGAFPSLVRWLPKPGEWMETFKQLMGFVLLGTVVYLFSTISSAYFIPTLALVIGVWFACWIVGRVPVYESADKQIWAWMSGCASATAIGLAAFNFLGPEKHLYEWQKYSPEAIAKLQSEGKTVMVDFTADWCLTCQANFKFAINTRGVEAVVKKNGVVPLLADWTDQNPTIKQKLAELNSNSIPLLAIYPANKPGQPIVLRDAITQKQLLTALETAGPSQAGATTASKTTAGAALAGQPSG